MKIKYRFANGEVSEVEVDDELGAVITASRREEENYLSPKACQGILRRASVRGKELPIILKNALERQALGSMDTTEA